MQRVKQRNWSGESILYKPNFLVQKLTDAIRTKLMGKSEEYNQINMHDGMLLESHLFSKKIEACVCVA